MVDTPGIIIVGAGVMGCSTAYWLTKAGCPVLLLEQASMACGASGMAAAMLESVGHGARLVQDDPLGELARASLALHHELARHLPDESGVDIGYREHLGIHAAFTPEDVATLQPHALTLHAQTPAVQWLEGQALWDVEPRLNRTVLGALVAPQAQVLAYRFVLALATAAAQRGMVMRHGTVVGLTSEAERVTGVCLRSGEILPTETVVLAMGPWTQRAASWVGLPLPITPVRGQLLALHVPDPQLNASISYGGMYLVRKADGVTLAGTTEEYDSGFANYPTAAGRQAMLTAALHLAPSLAEAAIQGHVSGLRPGSADQLPLIGPVPGWQGLYLVAGHFRSGMLLSAISGRLVADLITTGRSSLPIDVFDPGRFGQREV